MPPGFEPMRWNSVKKTAQWAVFRNSPEGFSLRGRGARSAARNPGGPAIFQQRKAYRFVTAVIEHVLCHHASHIAFQPSACVSKYGASASRQYGTPAGFLPPGVRMWHLDNSPAQPFQKNSPKVGKCPRRIEELPVIYSLALRTPCAVVAQLVEQLTRNEQVTGSSPVNGSMNSQRPASQRAFSYLRLVAAYSAGVSLPALFIRRCNRGRWCRRRACGNFGQGCRWQYPVQREEGRHPCSGRLPERR